MTNEELARKIAERIAKIVYGPYLQTQTTEQLEFTYAELQKEILAELQRGGESQPGPSTQDIQGKIIGNLLTRWELLSNDFLSVMEEEDRNFYAAMHDLAKSVEAGEFFPSPAPASPGLSREELDKILTTIKDKALLAIPAAIGFTQGDLQEIADVACAARARLREGE